MFKSVVKPNKNRKRTVHRCGAVGTMRACHAAGPGSIPGRDKFPGWGFFRGYSSPVRQMSGSFRPPWFPENHLAIIIIHHHSLRGPMTWDVDAAYHLKYTYTEAYSDCLWTNVFDLSKIPAICELFSRAGASFVRPGNGISQNTMRYEYWSLNH